MNQPIERVLIKDASRDILANFMTITLGIEVPDDAKVTTLRAQIIKAGWTKEDIPVLQIHSSSPKTSNIGNPVLKADGRYYITIVIPNSEGPGGEDAVPVQVNGSAMKINRGEPSEIPVEFVEALDNAKMDIYTPSNNGLQAPRVVHSYPFHYVN